MISLNPVCILCKGLEATTTRISGGRSSMRLGNIRRTAGVASSKPSRKRNARPCSHGLAELRTRRRGPLRQADGLQSLNGERLGHVVAEVDDAREPERDHVPRRRPCTPGAGGACSCPSRQGPRAGPAAPPRGSRSLGAPRSPARSRRLCGGPRSPRGAPRCSRGPPRAAHPLGADQTRRAVPRRAGSPGRRKGRGWAGARSFRRA